MNTEQQGADTPTKGLLTNNGVNITASITYSNKDKEKEDEGKKRRFSSFINHSYNNVNKRPNAAPIRVLLLGRPLSGKSSIISMLLNRDVHPGMNGRSIFVNNKPFITSPTLPQGPVLEDASTSPPSTPTHFNQPPTTPNPTTPTSQATLTPSASTTFFSQPITPTSFSQALAETSTTAPSPLPSTPTKFNSMDNEAPEDKMAISPIITHDPMAITSSPASPPATPPSSPPASPRGPSRSPSSSVSESSKLHAGRRIYHSDKYIITDIDGFHESNTSDIVGAVLEHRKWLEESMQGYNIVLVVIKAQEITDTDRKIFSLCNALLHDMKDMIHVVVTGCDMNPHWIQENEAELRRVYGGVKAVGVSFPSTEGGLLECIFEQMRKDSLVVLEEYISQNASANPRVPVKVPPKGGSLGSGEKKKNGKNKK